LEIVVEPKVLTANKADSPVEVVMTKGLLAPEPTRFKVAKGVVVLIPTLVPVSKIKELAVVDAPVALGKKPEVNDPDSLLLKVTQSVPWSCPVMPLVEKGRLKVKTLVEEARLKMLPAVPVAKVMFGPVAVLMEVMAEVK
jgi:hypothetical protein